MAEAGETPIESSDELTASMWGEAEAINPVLRNPGSYRTLCAEIDVHNLAVAALTDSSGSQLANFKANDNGAPIPSCIALGDEMSCAMPFQLLRALSAGWLKEANEHNSVVADELLHQLYRLICSPESYLHDPALHRVLQTSMRTLFFKLLGELQHLGAIIVFATFGRIVIATSKTDISAAQEYTEFIISTIKKRGGGEEGLGRVALSPTKYWTHFLFIDEENYGGVHYQQREPETDDEAHWAFELHEDTIVPTVVSCWNIVHYLARYLTRL
jgi:DNA polymerase epsilon subunit 1